MKVTDFSKWFEQVLDLRTFDKADASMNGMQVGRRSEEISRIALAVDASSETFRRAADAGADAVVVHHGLFWGRPIAVTGSHYERISLLLEHDMALFAAHLPLDAHPEVGNNAGIAETLDLRGTEPFGEYHGVMIGCRGKFEHPVTVQQLLNMLDWDGEPSVTVMPFGPRQIHTVGIVSGGAAMSVMEAIDENLDAYITGEAAHQVYHYCQEEGITMIAGGHYSTETYGVKLLGKKIEAETGIETLFIDLPTGL